MTDLILHLERLGLEQYLDAFVGEGFDTWDTLLDIQERDFDALNVKLGHRRKLQRAIAEHRGISYERLVGSPAYEGSIDTSRQSDSVQTHTVLRDGTQAPPTETKRKYRRHPKPDENAPEKPPSAYVLFSNKVREEIKGENLSFTNIAKLVGDRWQKLEPATKEPFETQARALKEQFNIQLSAYKKTDSYEEYAQYLADFKAKHGPATESKRPKLDPQSSGGSVSVTSADIPEVVLPMAGHVRDASLGSMSAASFGGPLPSTAALSIIPVQSLAALSNHVSRPSTNASRPASPPLPQFNRERRFLGNMSSHSSVSDESSQPRGDNSDPLPRTANLALNTPPAGTPPLLTYALGSARSEHSGSFEDYTWPSRPAPGPQTLGGLPSTNPPQLGTGPNFPSPTGPSGPDPWRDRGTDMSRTMYSPPTVHATTLPASVTFPPLLGTERMTDLTQSQAQRTLPPLRRSSISAQAPNHFMATVGSGSLPHRNAGGSISVLTHDNGSRTLDRNENEAASALAGLAGRPGHEPSAVRDRRRPH